MPTPEQEENVRKESSMKHWFPRLKGAGVRVPETRWVEIRDWEEATTFSEGVAMPEINDVQAAIGRVGGPPAFIRSDQSSNKHGMGRASHITSLDEEHVWDHVFETLEFNEMAGFAGLPYTHLAVREWLDLKHEFTAFHDCPIASELRFFIHEDEVHSFGFYWPQQAIEEHFTREDLRGDWKVLLAQVRDHALSVAEDRGEPWQMAEQVAEEFDGYWSIDFAETVDGEWYSIDMASGVASWHPDGCEKPEKYEQSK